VKTPAAFALAAAAVIALASTEAGAIAPLQSPVRPRLLVLGNSLVFSVPSASWGGSWGVAASAPERDFAHLLADRLGAELTADTIYPFEQQYAAPGKWRGQIGRHASPPAQWVVIKVGDNVATGNLPAYETALAEMISTVRGDAMVICVGTWYPRPADVDASTRRVCEASGARFVPIADLYFSFPNHALSERYYQDSGVGSHPGDAGMERIAERVHREIVTRRCWLPWVPN